MEQKKGPPIGIDLGTAYTRASIFNGSWWTMIPDDYGNPAMPSFVAFTEAGVLVGESARMQVPLNLANTIFDVVRLIGRRYSHLSTQNDVRLWPFKVIAIPQDRIVVQVRWKHRLCHFTPVEICSMILIKVKENAEKYSGETITDAVITVPANFNYEQRQAISQAGTIAGLNFMQIVTAPAANAYFYGSERFFKNSSIFDSISQSLPKREPVEHNIVIFDLGAGTLDVAVVTITKDVCKVRATLGEIHLGGSDFDNNLVDHFIDVLKKQEKGDVSNNPMAISNLRILCEKAKISLSSESSIASMRITPLYDDVDFESSITQAKFHQINNDLFLKCMQILEMCLRDAKIDTSQVDAVILAGGSARIPLVQSNISNFFKGKQVIVTENLEEATAYGAAIRAFLLRGRKDDKVLFFLKVHGLSLYDVVPFSLGWGSSEGNMVVCIPKNTTIPTNIERSIKSRFPMRTNFVFDVYEGEGDAIFKNNLLGTLELSANHPSPNGYTVTIWFKLDEDGILNVTAELLGTEIRNGITITSKNIEDSKKRVLEALVYKKSENNNIKAATKNLTRSGTSSQWDHTRAKLTITKLQKKDKERSENIKGRYSGKYAEPEKYAIGIDFGTTNSRVAVWRKNDVKIIENEYDSRATSSCVAFTDTGHLIGDTIHNEHVMMNIANVVPGIKRLIGRCYSDWSVQNDREFLPFKIVCGDRNRSMVAVQYKNEEKLFAPEEIAAMILSKMKEIAEMHLKSKITNAVISVPACFSDSQKKAIKNAGAIAGLDIMQLLNEPTATAIAYLLQEVSGKSSSEKTLLIFDLGGGNLDVSIFMIKENTIRVQAVTGETNLGGDDFDNNLVSYFVDKFKKEKKGDIANKPTCLRRMKAACEKAKRILSDFMQTTIEIDALDDGIDFRSTITRDSFEELNRDLFKRCIECVERCLAEAKIGKNNIDEVVLVGGSSRIPKVHQLLQEYFNGKELCDSMNLEETVAYGAAVQASILCGNEDIEQFCELKVRNVTSCSLWLDCAGGALSSLIPKNTPIPTKKELLFSTCSSDQTTMSIIVRSLVSDNKSSRAVFVLSNIPPKRTGASHIVVSFEVDEDGILNLTAKLTNSGMKNVIVVSKDNGGLTAEEIQKMIEAAARYEAEEEQHRGRAAAFYSLEKLAYEIKATARDPGVSSVRKKSLERTADDAVAWLETNYDAAVDEINAWIRKLETIISQIVYLGTNAS